MHKISKVSTFPGYPSSVSIAGFTKEPLKATALKRCIVMEKPLNIIIIIFIIIIIIITVIAIYGVSVFVNLNPIDLHEFQDGRSSALPTNYERRREGTE